MPRPGPRSVWAGAARHRLTPAPRGLCSSVDQTSPRQPIFNIPATIVVLIALMAGIHAARGLLPEARDADILARFAFVPGRFTVAFDPSAVLNRLMSSSEAGEAGQRLAVARFFLGDGTPQPWTVLTYAVLHGNWTHFGLNAVWLLAFGTPVARRFGVVRFVLFFVAGAIAGAGAHYLLFVADLQPLIGASASVSACMGATLRFMFQPQGRGRLAAPDLPRPAYRAPRLSLPALLRDRRALAFLLVWFATNLVTGIAAVPLGLSDAPVAWQAHVGGFLLGLLAFPLFDPAPAEPAPSDDPPPE